MQALTMTRRCGYWGVSCSQCKRPIELGEQVLCETFFVHAGTAFQQSPSTRDLGLSALKNWDLGLLQIELQTAVHLMCLQQVLAFADDPVSPTRGGVQS